MTPDRVERDDAEPVERIRQLLHAYVAFTTTHSDTHRCAGPSKTARPRDRSARATPE
ncbi:MAG: hypothetical protein HRT86_09825 [Ilumatobacteraceae bacterium]|nr:hypothetical protein [Ilumatobacteraceae bacterium]